MARPSMPVRVVVAEDGGEQVTITNVRERDEAGVEMRLVDWNGWRDTPDIRSVPIPIPGGDGDYDGQPLVASRTVTLKGVCYCPDVDTLVDRGDLMNRLLLGRRRSGTVAVQQADRRWWFARIRLGGASQWKETHVFPQARGEWSMSLYAADPKRYALDTSSDATPPFAPSGGFGWPLVFPIDFGPLGDSGLIRVHNGGTTDAPVRLQIPGLCVNPQVAQPETGMRLAFRTTLVDGQVLDIDTGARSVLRDGSAPFGWAMTSDSDFPLLPPGDSTLLFLTDSGTPTLTATWSDAIP